VLRRFLLILTLLLGTLPAVALTPEQAARIAAGDSDERIAALNEVVLAADPALQAYVQALLADEVKVAGGKAFVVRDGKAVEAATGAAATLPEGAEDVVNNNRVRRELEAALAALKLFSPDRAERDQAITDLKDQADEGKLVLLEKAIAAETDARLKARLELLKAAAMISSADKAKRLAAAQLLAGSEQPATRAAAHRAAGCRGRHRGQGGHRRIAGQGRFAPGLGRTPGHAVRGHQPGQHPAAGGAGSGHHLRPDGRHQHGARRADDDRRLRHLRGAEPVQGLAARAFDWYIVAGHPGLLPDRRAGGRGAGTHA
jgi:hypothetical protein